MNGFNNKFNYMKIKLQQLKEVIQKAVPEIMELKRGCKYLYTDRTASEGYVKQVEYICGGGHFKKEKGVGYFMSNAQWRKMDKITGRNITLEDCLIAINKNQKSHYVVCSDGEFSEPTPEGIYRFSRFWQFNEPLQNQSDETLEFIFNLLK